MRHAVPNIDKEILEKTIEMLCKKEPHEIGMREIAGNCNITTTSIYSRYKDKDTLFYSVILYCVDQLKKRIIEKTDTIQGAYKRTEAAMQEFCDWSFEEPRRALLVMGKIPAKTEAPREELRQYYICNELGAQFIRQGIAEGTAVSDDPHLDAAVMISALWGTIEALLLKRTDTQYWTSGKKYTDRFISRYLANLFPNKKDST